MAKTFEANIVTKQQFQAVGLKWQGTFAEAGAGGIREVMKELQDRLSEIECIANRDSLLGLSYLDIPGGFTHYSVVEVTKVNRVPSGMLSLTVPTLTYAQSEHHKGENIDQSYKNVFEWIEANGYSHYKADLAHYEEYPMTQDSYSNEPEFNILIPIIENRLISGLSLFQNGS